MPNLLGCTLTAVQLFKAGSSVVKDAVSIFSYVSDRIKLYLASLIPDENYMATQSGNIMGFFDDPF